MKIEHNLKYKLSFSLKELEKGSGDPVTISLFKIILEEATSTDALRKEVSEFQAKIKASKPPPHGGHQSLRHLLPEWLRH